ncbi:UMTA methyltransferase [Colletotrichum truncatum]|uniref:UMTA methyltransferase n=1 Tax=Colletotrichum truncatum TaxID=5467 RepID=A0ACC3YJ97_COLTU
MGDSSARQPAVDASAPGTATPQAASNPAAPSVEAISALGNEQLEIDDDATSDLASTIDERISQYTASLSSSIIDYPVEYGRRYHAFRPGSYAFPNDEREMDRLDMAHALIVKTIGSRLYLAPIQKDEVRRILDIGTGTGIWAVEMGDIFENAEVIGNDLSAIQPDWVPPNVKFEIDDVESSWVGHQKYDFIMCRYMAASIKDWPKLVKNIYDNLNPGGWAEFQDVTSEWYSEDGTLSDKSFAWNWNRTLGQACRDIGRDPSPGAKLEGWVNDAGFQNIFHQRFKTPLGFWPKDPYYREIGMLNIAQLLDGLEGFTLKLSCNVLGRTKEETLVQIAQVRKELKSGSMHIIYDTHVVYGQKPLEETEE